MKEQIKTMYDNISMPQECRSRIAETMAKRSKRPDCRRRRSLTACACLVLALSLTPQVRAAVGALVKTYVFMDSGIVLWTETDEEENTQRIVGYDTQTEPYAKAENGRLYFTGQGQRIDITDQTRGGKPYIYTYQDDYGFTHYMAVGWEGSVENFGIQEFLREEKEGQQPWEGWFTGAGQNFLDPQTERAYPWVVNLWQELDIPWPMPGDDSTVYIDEVS